ncbi:hypothetical protein OHB07_16240 [Streptomyces sp. NBC_00111]|uniref:hypothetical protein n=1 Tax=Streptomyces sp. NBC_00111 TaxID=2975655 RepID=UPI003250F73E
MSDAPSYTALYDPEKDARPIPFSVDRELGLARKVLEEKAPANIHDRDEMIRAAAGLEMRLRALVAALDREAGR